MPIIKPPIPQLTGFASLWWGATNLPYDPQTSYAGQTVLVTGSNTGLGLEAAVKFAALGASTLVLAVRTVSKGEAAKEIIVERTGCDPNVIKVMQLDMSTFASVKAFATKLSAEVDQLDVAVLNAGISSSTYQTSPEGWEMTLQVNTLSTAMLAILLLPKLRETEVKTGRPPHLEMVGSKGHTFVKPETVAVGPDESILEKLNAPEAFRVLGSYSTSKLLVMYVMEGLVNATTKPDGNPQVIINVTCPGFCRSEINRDFPFYFSWPLWAALQVFGRTSEQGSRTLVSATCQGPEGNGKFWNHDVNNVVGELVTNEQGKKLQKKSWSEILAVLQKHEACIENILKP